MRTLTSMNISPLVIRNLAIVIALVLAPVLSYGSAYLLYKQIDTTVNKHANGRLVKAPIEEKQSLPRELIDRIAVAIDTAEKRS